MKATLFVWLTTLVTANALRHRKLVRAQAEKRIDDEYILVFREDMDTKTKVAELSAMMPDCQFKFTYEDEKFQGTAIGNMSASQLSTILEDPDILYIEEDQIMEEFGVQYDPSWGLDRLDEASLPLDKKYSYQYSGKGVKAFVIDSGIANHPDLRSPTCGYSAFGSCLDEGGHGTHVSGIIGGTKYGVAKQVELVTVRVIDAQGKGSTSGLLAGMDYIHKQKKSNPKQPMVANMSLGGSFSQALNNLVDNIVNAGVFVAVAAGNQNKDACGFSPASSGRAVTVASSNNYDARSSYSNFGPCVNIFAPGEGITSTWFDNRSILRSGTSMASPHVAGVAALYLEAHPSWSPDQVWNAMQSDAVSGVISDSRASPNRLVNTQKLGGSVLMPANAPVQPPTNSGGCCSYNFKSCIDIEGWCGKTQGECTSCQSDVKWLPKGKLSGCLARWENCRFGSCCPGMNCVKKGMWYSSCEP